MAPLETFHHEAVDLREQGKFIIPMVIIIGVWVGYIGWRGATMLEITSLAGSKAQRVKGKDIRLLEFGKSVAHQLR